MGRAFLSLYTATADRTWLDKASKVGLFIKKTFESKSVYTAGYLTASSKSSKVAKPEPLPDENAMLARFSNLLFHYTGDQTFKAMSKKAMQYIATPQIAKRRKILVAGPLLADRELSRDPVHVTIVGSKSDAKAKRLFKAALTSPSVYKRIEWYDRKEGKLPNMEVDYPPLPKAAAFSCGNGICSPPKYEPENVKEFFKSKRTSG